MSEAKKPKLNSLGNKELDKAEDQFKEFDAQVKSMTLDRMNMAPKEETEQQTKLSTREIDKQKDIYLKPKRTIASKEKFNEKFRDNYNFDKEYVNFIAENKEIIGEDLDIWTKPYPGLPAEEWIIPVNKPIWGPRYVAEQIKRCTYHKLVMRDQPTNADGFAQYYGTMAVDTQTQRLDAHPVTKNRSVFMGATNF